MSFNVDMIIFPLKANMLLSESSPSGERPAYLAAASRTNVSSRCDYSCKN